MEYIFNKKTFFHVSLFILILFYAIFSRLYGLDRLSLWSDELWVVTESTKGSLWDMFKYVYYYDNHPPGHYLIMRYTQLWFGNSDFIIRLPSAMAGLLIIPFIYIAGRKHLSPEAALIAAALVAGSYPLIYYSQEARPNIFIALFGLTAFHYFRAISLEKDHSIKNYILFFISCAILCYFHYSGLVFVCCLAIAYLCILIRFSEKNKLASFIKLFAPIFILYTPWISAVYHDITQTPIKEWQKIPDIRTLTKTMWFLFGPEPARYYLFVANFFIIFFLLLSNMIGLKKLKDIPVHFIILAFFLAFFPISVFYLKSIFSQSAYNHRHFLYAIPLMALTTAYFISLFLCLFKKNYRKPITAIIIFSILAWQTKLNMERNLYTGQHFKEEYREAAKVALNDTTFLGHANNAIFQSNGYFDHYLNSLSNGDVVSQLIYHSENDIENIKNNVKNTSIKEFYYLERIRRGAAVWKPANKLAEYYAPLCRTTFIRTQAIKFNTSDKPSKTIDWERLSNCPSE